MKRVPAGVFVSAVFLGAVTFLSIFADFFALYPAAEENRRQPFHPPTSIHWDLTGGFPKPYVLATVMTFDENFRRIYTEDTSRKFYLKGGGPRLVHVESPGRLYLLGADGRGRDLFSRMLYGGRISLSIGIIGALLTGCLGFFVGAAAGYFGGRVDFCLMRLAEFFIMIPGFYFLLALRGALPPGLSSFQVYLLTVGVLSLIGWGAVARVIRGLSQSLRQSDFVQAARVLGRSHFQILTGHIFPHVLPYLFVVLSIAIPGYILMESAMSLLGLGIQEPEISWGNLLNEAVSVAHLSLHPWVLYPGGLLALTALAFNRLGDGIRTGAGE